MRRLQLAGSLMGAAWVALTAVGGCGGSDGSGAPAGGSGPDAGGDAATSGSGGGSGASGGTSGAGGVSASGGAGAGSGGGGTSSGGGPDAGVDAGPSCTPRAEVPAPVPRTLEVQSSCGAAPTCGGTATGTWEVVSACVAAGSAFPAVLGVCSAAGSPASLPSRPNGTVSIQADSATGDVSASLTAFIDFPNACHGCQCGTLEAQLQSAGLDASCNPVCNGGSCSCTLSRTFSASLAGTLDPGSYCVDGDTLTLEAGGAVFTLRPPAALHTPEICNGLDDDGNGEVDDDPVDCPTCSAVGACAEGVTATCAGSSGWTCEYTSPAWEATETLCDALDNDCDGLVNEDLGCQELCDGKDNDGIGGVDDSPAFPPTCTTVGVCAGSTAKCGGAAGWTCSVSNAGFEAAETLCDGKDNDCNGVTDERCCAAGSARLYYGYIDAARTGAFVARSDYQGGNVQPLVTLPLATILDVSVDPIGGKLYWANITTNEIQRSNLDGSNVETALATGSQPRLALDVAHRAAYSAGGTIRRTSLDDLTNTVDLPIPVSPLTMTVDSQHGWLFLGAGNIVYRADLDGGALLQTKEDLAVVGQVIEGIAVDPVGAKVYWASAGGLHRANLDLTAPEKLVTLSYPHHVHVDAVARRLFWSETVSNDIGSMDIGATTPDYIPLSDLSVRLGDLVACPP